MKPKIDFDSLDTQLQGEILRGLVFDQSGDRLGCYSSFDVNEGFEEINPDKYPQLVKISCGEGSADFFYIENQIKISAYESQDLVVMWWWDGDGDLLIWVKGEPTCFCNGDCKKSSTWTEVTIQ